jgi:hypothetical protein
VGGGGGVEPTSGDVHLMGISPLSIVAPSVEERPKLVLNFFVKLLRFVDKIIRIRIRNQIRIRNSELRIRIQEAN